MDSDSYTAILRTAVRTNPLLVSWARAALQTGRSARSLSIRLATGHRFTHRAVGSSFVSICHPDWQGVRSAAEGQGGDLLLLPDLSGIGIRQAVNLILQSEYDQVVFNGFWLGYDRLINNLKKEKPNIRIYYIHHGSFAQVTETYEGAKILKRMVELFHAGKIEKIAFVKDGMDKAFQFFGTNAEMVFNRVPLSMPPKPKLWSDPAVALIPSGRMLRKNCHTQIVAALISEAFDEIHVTENELSYLKMNDRHNRKIVAHNKISRNQVLSLMNKTTITFNVTLSECAPMVVLESFSSGVPCISGNNHGLLDSNEILFDSLIVDREDDVFSIVDKIKHIRDNYDHIAKAVHAFAGEYDSMAKLRFDSFLA